MNGPAAPGWCSAAPLPWPELTEVSLVGREGAMGTEHCEKSLLKRGLAAVSGRWGGIADQPNSWTWPFFISSISGLAQTPSPFIVFNFLSFSVFAGVGPALPF